MEKPEFRSFTRPNGHDEFQEFLQELPSKDADKLVATILRVQEHGLQDAARMEWIKPLDKNLYELRSKVASNIQRAIYFHVVGSDFVITHGFTKKTQKTPASEIKHGKLLRDEFYEMDGE
ncbi:type II toxin-antitoxin system RelE/ParE family toxin [Weissella sp. GP1]|uniref:type II toxin-antitoxin system RelE/ParE family toxin n=1 Tax=Weissella confusa TaxID=1583 RepID=UPI0032D9D278